MYYGILSLYSMLQLGSFCELLIAQSIVENVVQEYIDCEYGTLVFLIFCPP